MEIYDHQIVSVQLWGTPLNPFECQFMPTRELGILAKLTWIAKNSYITLGKTLKLLEMESRQQLIDYLDYGNQIGLIHYYNNKSSPLFNPGDMSSLCIDIYESSFNDEESCRDLFDAHAERIVAYRAEHRVDINRRGCYVYIAKSAKARIVKIGKSQRPYYRARQLSKQLDDNVEILAAWWDQSGKQEAEIHAKFADYRTTHPNQKIEREWFRYEEDIQKLVSAYPSSRKSEH